MNVALAAAATLVAVAFALSTFDRWSRRGRPHEQAWAISLAMFALGSAALWWAQVRGWSNGSFRVFYLAGAVLNVPWLALGTVFLLAGPRAGAQVRSALVLLTGFAAGVVLFAPTTSAVAGAGLPTGSDVFGPGPRVLAAVGSGLAAVVIIAGALLSALRAHHRQPRMVSGNLLIAAGTIVLSASGTLAARLGKDRAFSVTLLAGIAVLFVGFLVAGSSGPARSGPARSGRPSQAVDDGDVAVAG